ncbi:MAG: FliA/WhiG family RNA polymerase sigma factor [Desulfobacteraceae bacterium]
MTKNFKEARYRGMPSPQAAKKLKKYTQLIPSGSNGISAGEREALVTKYAPLVKTIAGRLALRLPQHIGQDDLTSAGLMGLLDAIDKFDVEKGVEFKSYAEFRIKGAMIDELRSMDWVPRSVRKNAKLLAEAYARVENREMRPAQDEEVAEELGMEMEAFYRLLDESRGISIFNEYDMQIHNTSGEGQSDGGAFEIGFDQSPLQSLKKTELVQIIAGAIDRLPKNERTAVSLYYYEELTMKEIGEVMGYTESRVSQLHTKAVLRLKNSLKNYFDKK